MQAAPELPLDGYVDVSTSNHHQQRGSHGLFRYFGKLAPDATGAILDLALAHTERRGLVIDLMSGSGTTLVEAANRGLPSVGTDVNPVACLYASCKTRAINRDAYDVLLDRLQCAPLDTIPSGHEVFSNTRNADRWFSDEAQHAVSCLRGALASLTDGRETNLLLAVLLSQLRHISNASARTGRIFYDPSSSAANPMSRVLEAAKRAADLVPTADLPAHVIQADARRSPLPNGSGGVVFCHPPYFALYRFSSDVLRFELEVGGYTRRRVARHEIREGWKSGDPANLEGYLYDMGVIFSEAQRLLAPGGVFVLVASNSTLGDRQLPVIDLLAALAPERGLSLEGHYQRRAYHGTATYHRSARIDKVVKHDHVLLFKARSVSRVAPH